MRPGNSQLIHSSSTSSLELRTGGDVLPCNDPVCRYGIGALNATFSETLLRVCDLTNLRLQDLAR